MRILITGGTGFVGQNFVPHMLSQHSEHELLLLCRNVSAAQAKYRATDYPQLQSAPAEDWSAVVRFNPELVIHLAAFSTAANDETVIDRLIDSNIRYGVHLLHALSACSRLRLFVNTGSFAEYRQGVRCVDNAYLYSATKSAFRCMLDYYAKLYNFNYLTAIPYSVYGGIPTIKRIMDYLLEAADATTPIAMTPGEQVLDFIHVDDVAAFYSNVCNNIAPFLNLPQGYEFHLGTGRGYTLREVASQLEQVLGKRLNIQWGGRPYRERDTMYAVAPISMNSEYDLWHSRITLVEGLRRLRPSAQ
jgi:CDP-paratose synthetase